MKDKSLKFSKQDRRNIKSVLDLIFNTDCNLSMLKTNSKFKDYFVALYQFKLIHITRIEQRILLTSEGEDLLYYLNSELI